MCMSKLPTVILFNKSDLPFTDDNIFLRRFIYILCNNLTAKLKVSIVCISNENHLYFCNQEDSCNILSHGDLNDPMLPKDRNYDELKEILEKQFTPRVFIFRHRIKFDTLQQE